MQACSKANTAGQAVRKQESADKILAEQRSTRVILCACSQILIGRAIAFIGIRFTPYLASERA